MSHRWIFTVEQFLIDALKRQFWLQCILTKARTFFCQKLFDVLFRLEMMLKMSHRWIISVEQFLIDALKRLLDIQCILTKARTFFSQTLFDVLFRLEMMIKMSRRWPFYVEQFLRYEPKYVIWSVYSLSLYVETAWNIQNLWLGQVRLGQVRLD